MPATLEFGQYIYHRSLGCPGSHLLEVLQGFVLVQPTFADQIIKQLSPFDILEDKVSM